MKSSDPTSDCFRRLLAANSMAQKYPFSPYGARMGAQYGQFRDTVGKTGIEPVRLATRDPKSRLSASSSTSPVSELYARAEISSIISDNCLKLEIHKLSASWYYCAYRFDRGED